MINIEQIFKSESFHKGLNISPETNIEYSRLGAGEYNVNYLFSCEGEKLVLRIPAGSQMKLKDQASYEYEALKLLEKSERTPKPLFVCDDKSLAPYGFLVMEYLPGQPLRYESHMSIASQILADIHNIDTLQGSLIKPESPIDAILRECRTISDVYFCCDKGKSDSKKLLKEILDKGKNISAAVNDFGGRCIINTELNSGNFLINGENQPNYLVDWEKPLFAYAFQDLGHFLAPTTTFWKTDTILTKEDIFCFLDDYCRHSVRYKDPEKLWESTLPYFTMNCLRGLSWCAMAWVEYQSAEKTLKNQFAYEKIQTYLDPGFLEMICRDYLG